MTEVGTTWWVRLYLSGPIDVAKQVCREECLREGLCVTIEATTFIYTGGEEAGYSIGLIAYPRFPASPESMTQRGYRLAMKLLDRTYQRSALVMTPEQTIWITRREEVRTVKGGKKKGGGKGGK